LKRKISAEKSCDFEGEVKKYYSWKCTLDGKIIKKTASSKSPHFPPKYSSTSIILTMF